MLDIKIRGHQEEGKKSTEKGRKKNRNILIICVFDSVHVLECMITGA